MITVYEAASAHRFDHGWLKGSHLFSFGDYYDPANTAFGPMRICNDDTIAPGKGFGAHPHSDMEIVSIVLSGRLRHEDNLGNVAETGFGGIQRMSAGTGVIHTEHNPSPNEPVRILQLWFMPMERGAAPSYETGRFETGDLEGRLLPVVSGEGKDGPVSIGQDMTIYLGRFAEGGQARFRQAPGRRMFVYLIEGELEIPGEASLREGDSARVEAVQELALDVRRPSFFMLIDLP